MSEFLILFDLIGQLARRRYQAGERSFATVGLNHTEARLLSLLQHHDGAAAQDALSALLHVDRSNAGRALQRLESAGLVTRSKDGEDKRANFVRMTATGRKKVVEIGRLRKKIADEFFGDLTEEEAAAAAVLLRKALPENCEHDS